jgi:hypothetical protein
MKLLVVIAGPTAIGKTAFAIAIARHFNTVILSADSRQIFKETTIGTAKPTVQQLNEVPHYFINHISIAEAYNAGKYEAQAIQLLTELFAEKDICDFNKIISCVKKTKPTIEDLQESANYIKFYIYDIPSINSVFVERNIVLQSLTYSKYCVIVPTVKVDTVEQSDILYCQYMTDGYEGQMLRVNDVYENKRSKHLIKRKEFTTEEFNIADVLEGKGKLANKVGKLDFGTFDSAVNGTHDYLKMLWDTKDTLIGVTATVKYFELTEDGVPRFPKVIAINREAYE